MDIGGGGVVVPRRVRRVNGAWFAGSLWASICVSKQVPLSSNLVHAHSKRLPPSFVHSLPSDTLLHTQVPQALVYGSRNTIP